MCRRPTLLLLALCALAPALRAQGAESADARDRRLLARAESLSTRLEARRRQVARETPPHRSRLLVAHGLTVVLDGAAPEAEARAAMDSAAELLDELGTVPRVFLARTVFVWSGSQDTGTVLAGSTFDGWRRLGVGIPNVARGPRKNGAAAVVPGYAEAGWPMARAALAAYAATLDAEWQEWLPGDYGLKGSLQGGEARPWQMFAPASSSTGAGCLNGRAPACRLWLGLDRDANPYATRYSPADLRVVFQTGWYPGQNGTRYRACMAGSDSSCVAFAHEVGRPAPVPADASARRSFLRAVHDFHGAPALAAALADTTGPLGARLARATGASEDALVLEWRRRVLDHSRRSLVLGGTIAPWVGVREAVSTLFFAGLLLLAAAGSGRWR